MSVVFSMLGCMRYSLVNRYCTSYSFEIILCLDQVTQILTTLHAHTTLNVRCILRILVVRSVDVLC